MNEWMDKCINELTSKSLEKISKEKKMVPDWEVLKFLDAQVFCMRWVRIFEDGTQSSVFLTALQ